MDSAKRILSVYYLQEWPYLVSIYSVYTWLKLVQPNALFYYTLIPPFLHIFLFTLRLHCCVFVDFSFALHMQDLKRDLRSEFVQNIFHITCSAPPKRVRLQPTLGKTPHSFTHTHNSTSLQTVRLRQFNDSRISSIVFPVLFSTPMCVSGFDDCNSPTTPFSLDGSNSTKYHTGNFYTLENPLFSKPAPTLAIVFVINHTWLSWFGFMPWLCPPHFPLVVSHPVRVDTKRSSHLTLAIAHLPASCH